MIFKSSAAKKAIIALVIFPIIFMNGCFDSIEVDEQVFVVAMGLDSGTNGNLRLSLLFAVPIAVGVGPEPGEIDKATTMITVEAPSIYGGVNVINGLSGKKVNFSHSKLIIISRELAEKGVEKYINTFIRFREFRPHTYLAISRQKAEDFLKESKPILELNPAKYYELLMEAYKYTGFTTGTTLEEFYMKMECTCNQAVADLIDVNKTEDEEDFESILFRINGNNGGTVMEGDYKAGEIPVIYNNKSSGMGTAVFRGDRMVGELDGRETLNFLMVTGRLGYVYFSIPDPDESNSGSSSETGSRNYVSLRLTSARKPIIKVKMEGDTPVITVNVSLEGDILAIDSDMDYSTGDQLKQLESYAAEYIKREISSFLKKTRDEMNSDICGTGKDLKKKFLLWDDWISFKWTEKYKKAQFEVNTKVSIRRPGVTIRQIPVKSLKGEQ